MVEHAAREESMPEQIFPNMIEACGEPTPEKRKSVRRNEQQRETVMY